MRIICPTCSSHYEVEPEGLPPSGQLVRCGECREVWLVRAADVVVSALPGRGAAPDLSAETRPAAQPPVPPIDFAAARARLRPRREPLERERSAGGSLVLAAVVLGLGALTAALAGRAAIVRHVPQTAALFQAVGLQAPGGLALREVRSALADENGKTVLTLQGTITNLGESAAPVPPLVVAVRGGDSVPLYTWTATAPKARLARGETVAFRSRLAAPPADGRDVRVSFAQAL